MQPRHGGALGWRLKHYRRRTTSARIYIISAELPMIRVHTNDWSSFFWAAGRPKDLNYRLLLRVATIRLRDLLGEGGEVEVVAPHLDPASVVQLEHPSHRDIRLLAVFHRDRVDARVENDIALVCALQDLDHESRGILEKAVGHLADRRFAFGGCHRDVVPYGVFGEIAHDVIDAQTAPGGEEIAYDFFTVNSHGDGLLVEFDC